MRVRTRVKVRYYYSDPWYRVQISSSSLLGFGFELGSRLRLGLGLGLILGLELRLRLGLRLLSLRTTAVPMAQKSGNHYHCGHARCSCCWSLGL